MFGFMANKSQTKHLLDKREYKICLRNEWGMVLELWEKDLKAIAFMWSNLYINTLWHVSTNVHLPYSGLWNRL